MVKIGHAVMDENGKAVGAKIGDQTGKEICIAEWYPNNSNVYLECIDKAMAKESAEIMKEICNNSNYGYSQLNRWSGYQSIIANGKNIAKGKGNFDCSSLVLACYILAGLNIKPEGYTGSMRGILLATGKFKAYTASKYLTSDKYAKVGGIYLKEGSHVVMALEDYSKKKTEDKAEVKVDFAKSYNKAYGKAYTTTTDLNLRTGAGVTKSKITVIPKGATVHCYGYYTMNGNTPWLSVTYENYTGFCSAKYLK